MYNEKYKVTYPLQGINYRHKFFETFEEALVEYIKLITPAERICLSESRFADIHISKWNEEQGIYIAIK